MVSYGPWIQEPDYEASQIQTARSRVQRLYEAGFRTDVEQYGQWMTYNTGWRSVDGNEVAGAFENVKGSMPTYYFNAFEFDQGRSFANLLTRNHDAGTVGGADWGSGGSVSINRHPWIIKAGFSYFPYDQPAGAIGIEFEGVPTSEVPNFDTYGRTTLLGAEIAYTTKLKSENLDDSNTLYPSGPISSSPLTSMRVQRANEYNIIGSDGDVLYLGDEVAPIFFPQQQVGGTRFLGELGLGNGGSIDLHNYLDGIQSAGIAVFTITSDFISPVHDDGNFAYQNSWSYGWWIDELHLNWTLRPPRYRWVYGTDPIRRTFPRDDSLAGGAGRTWPPPKSAQQSNRTFGGYI